MSGGWNWAPERTGASQPDWAGAGERRPRVWWVEAQRGAHLSPGHRGTWPSRPRDRRRPGPPRPAAPSWGGRSWLLTGHQGDGHGSCPRPGVWEGHVTAGDAATEQGSEGRGQALARARGGPGAGCWEGRAPVPGLGKGRADGPSPGRPGDLDAHVGAWRRSPLQRQADVKDRHMLGTGQAVAARALPLPCADHPTAASTPLLTVGPVSDQCRHSQEALQALPGSRTLCGLPERRRLPAGPGGPVALRQGLEATSAAHARLCQS